MLSLVYIMYSIYYVYIMYSIIHIYIMYRCGFRYFEEHVGKEGTCVVVCARVCSLRVSHCANVICMYIACIVKTNK